MKRSFIGIAINLLMNFIRPIFNRQKAEYGLSGTPLKRIRTPGKKKKAGNKISRMAAEHRLDHTSAGGVIGRAMRQMRMNENLARLVNK